MTDTNTPNQTKPLTVKDMLAREQDITEDIKSSVATYKSVIGDPSTTYVIYASAAITSGKRMYDLMKEMGITDVQELKTTHKDIYRKRVIEENIASGRIHVQEQRARKIPSKQNPGEYIKPIVIAPVDYMERQWPDEAFMVMWDQVFTEFAHEGSFNDNPYFSTGQAEEFWIGVRENKILTHRQNNTVMDPRKELEKFEESIDYIADVIKGVPTKLYNIYRKAAVRVKG